MRLVLLLVIAVLGAWGTSPLARAQDDDSASRDREARSLYDAGRIAFDEGRFENALDYFKRAYDLSHRAGLLYNIGTTADRLRHDEEALEAFQAYLEAAPDGPNRASVEARIAVLQRSIAEREQAEAAQPVIESPSEPAPPATGPTQPAASPAAAPAPVPMDSGPPPAVGWSLLGGGGGAAIAGAILLGIGQSHRNKIENAAVGSSWSSVSKYDNADRLTGAGVAMLGIGLAAAAVGLVLTLRSGGDDQAESGRTTTLVVGPGSVLVRGTM